MLNVSDEKMKVIGLLLTSTGMRLGRLAGLKISSLQKIEEFQLYRVSVYDNSAENTSVLQRQNVLLPLTFI
jgi:hypothetical protein